MQPRLHVCENFFPLQSLKAEFEGKRFEWKIEQTLQRPRVVGARIAPFLTKENLFAQVVVRLHTAQVTSARALLFISSYIQLAACLTVSIVVGTFRVELHTEGMSLHHMATTSLLAGVGCLQYSWCSPAWSCQSS